MSETSRKIINKDILYPELSYNIVGAIYEIWKKLGPAFKESVYQKALEEELKHRQINFIAQKQIPILYNKKKVGVYVPDIIIDDKIILELKHCPQLTLHDKKQLWYYLRGTDYKLALLINFGGKRLQIMRYIYDKARFRVGADSR